MKALVTGVNGLTGRAMAAEFAEAGWDVTGTGRSRSRFPAALLAKGITFVQSDRGDEGALRHAIALTQPDLVVDCVAYTAAHARQLVESHGAFGSAVVLSSKAVYVDDEGRHSNSDEPPRFAAPVTEQNAVCEPDWSGEYRSRGGYGGNKVAMEQVLRESGLPVSILRPSRIHGVGAAPSREWFVVKRVLDGRTAVPLAHRGLSGNHPTAAVNLARLARVCAETPGARTLNAADPGAPTARDVVTAIAAATGTALDVVGRLEVVGLPDEAPAGAGYSPWSTWPPFFLDTSAAAALGYAPVGPYAVTVAAAVEQLLALSPAEQAALTNLPYFDGLFDYAGEDAVLGSGGEAAGG